MNEEQFQPQAQQEPTPPKPNPIVALIVIAALIGGAYWYLNRGSGTSNPPIDLFDTGTWELSLNSTDCGDLTSKMTIAEQVAVSRSLLAVLRSNTLAGAPAPSLSLVTTFKDAMSKLCREQGRDYPIIAAAAVVYTADKSYEPDYR